MKGTRSLELDQAIAAVVQEHGLVQDWSRYDEERIEVRFGWLVQKWARAFDDTHTVDLPNGDHWDHWRVRTVKDRTLQPDEFVILLDSVEVDRVFEAPPDFEPIEAGLYHRLRSEGMTPERAEDRIRHRPPEWAEEELRKRQVH